VLLRLLLEAVEALLGGIFDLLPDAPAPITALGLPIPVWVPAETVLGSLLIVVVAGAAFLGLRALRWVYGLVPVAQ
jgi:hypothetical protein